ncbi:MAG: hypothetical protein OJF50_000398 [Nitrospira sp.]|nr:hypothetical protein [Nitrospira sp.]
MFTKRSELVGVGGKRSDVAKRGRAWGAEMLLTNVAFCA